jgi:hypothetical protein
MDDDYKKDPYYIMAFCIGALTVLRQDLGSSGVLGEHEAATLDKILEMLNCECEPAVEHLPTKEPADAS